MNTFHLHLTRSLGELRRISDNSAVFVPKHPITASLTHYWPKRVNASPQNIKTDEKSRDSPKETTL